MQKAFLVLMVLGFMLMGWVSAQEETLPVILDGATIFEISTTPDQTAEERRDRVERRLERLLETPEVITPAQVQVIDGQTAITVAGLPVVFVTEEDAQENLTTIPELAASWAAILDTELGEAAERRSSGFGRLTTEVSSSFVGSLRSLVLSAVSVIPSVLAALLVLAMFWLIAALSRRLLETIFNYTSVDQTDQNLIERLVYYGIWFIGIFVGVSALGLNAETLATGLGLTSLALGFALQDILSNLVSGFLILVLRPFKIGDQIVIGETEGTVTRIELRATQVLTYDGRVVLVPNAEIFTSRVANNTAAPVRRSSVFLFVEYDENLSDVLLLLQEATRQTPEVLADHPVTVLIRNLDRQLVEMEVMFWTDSRRRDFLISTSKVRHNIITALKAANVAVPSTVQRIDPARVDLWQDAMGNPRD